MTEFEKSDKLNRMGADDSVDKLLNLSSEFEPSDAMPLGLISEALTNRKRKYSPLLPLIFVGTAGVALIAICFASYREALPIAVPIKNIDSKDNHKEVSAVYKFDADLQDSRLDSLLFNNIAVMPNSETYAVKTAFVISHRRIRKRRRSASMSRSSSNIELGDAKTPANTYAAMWKTEIVEKNYSGILATALVAAQDEQDRIDGTFIVTPAIIDLPLNPGDTITTTEETDAVPVSTLNYKEENP